MPEKIWAVTLKDEPFFWQHITMKLHLAAWQMDVCSAQTGHSVFVYFPSDGPQGASVQLDNSRSNLCFRLSAAFASM